MTRPSHAALVEEVAKAIARIWTSENKNANQDQAAVLFKPSAEAAIDAVAARLSDVTPEMVEAVARALCNAAGENPDEELRGETDPFPHWAAWADDARAAISAFLAVSPLTPGEKGEG